MQYIKIIQKKTYKNLFCNKYVRETEPIWRLNICVIKKKQKAI